MAAPQDTPATRRPDSSAETGPGRAELLRLTQSMPCAVLFTDTANRLTWLNDASLAMIGVTLEEAVGRPVRDLVPLAGTDANTFRRLREALTTGQPFEGTVFNRDRAGVGRWLRLQVSPTIHEGAVIGFMTLATDVTEQLQLDRRVEFSERMAAMGTLATGVAHEINTPVQFVSDSLHFLSGATGDLMALIDALVAVRSAVLTGAPATDLAAAAVAAEDDADLAYLRENMPKAIESCLDGVDRVSTIVRSVKEFAHPNQVTMTSVDLNHAVATTLTLARNEYKYVADLVTDFGDLPPVRCLVGGINQVVLNLVVNAAHAIGARVKGTGTKGRITVRTRAEGDHVVIAIEDTGGGIAADIRDRIFESFFTTKAVGEGTGQGLSLARSIVAKNHGGTLTFDTVEGTGSTFYVRLPIAGKADGSQAGVAA